MKRVKAACICQTLRFMQKEELGHDRAAALTRQEMETYKRGLERSHTQYKIVEETEEADGSITVKIIKQYNSSPVGNYLD